MEKEEKQILAELRQALDGMRTGRFCEIKSNPDASVSPETRELLESCKRLGSTLAEVQRFAVDLSSGKIDSVAPPREAIFGPLKALQSSLRHLVWQTQEVAAGDLSQRVDFLGDFSTAFNRMVESLREKEKLEKVAAANARLAGIGKLAGGLAHELNTPLQSICDNLSFLEMCSVDFAGLFQKISDEAAGESLAVRLIDQAGAKCKISECRDAIGDLLSAAGRIGAIVKSMKELTGSGGGVLNNVRINELVHIVTAVWSDQRLEAVPLKILLDPEIPEISCDPQEVGSVLEELISNALWAVQKNREGPQAEIGIVSRSEGDWVLLDVYDTGCGVPDELKERIFEPFFSTRDVGGGVGQGLSLSRAIIARHGGQLSVQDRAGGGAVFSVRLPVKRSQTQ